MNSVTESVGFRGTEKAHRNLGSIADRVVRKSLPVELVGRFDGIITFNALSKDDIGIICEIELGKLQQRVRKGTTPFLFSVTKAGRDEICREAYSTKYNARELKRVIAKRVEQPLAACLSSNQISVAEVIRVDHTTAGWTYTNCGSCEPIIKELRAEQPAVSTFLLPAAPPYAEFPTFGA